jgi:hypothetical protein
MFAHADGGGDSQVYSARRGGSDLATPPAQSPFDSALATVTALLAVVGGLAGLVTVLGGVALTLRLWSRGLPTESIAGGLPTSLFLSVGLDAALQLLVFGGLIALVVLAGRDANWAVLIMAAAASVLVYPFLRTTIDEPTWALSVAVGGLLTTLGGFALLQRFADRRWFVLAGVVLVFLAWRIPFEISAAEVVEVKACTMTGTETVGLFVGESDSTLFIGVTGDAPHIAEIPGDQVYRAFLGEDVSEATCPPVPNS